MWDNGVNKPYTMGIKKLFYIVTTIPSTLNFFRGQLAYLSDMFEIVAISSDKAALENFGDTEGIETHYIPMMRSISLLHDFKSLIKIISFFSKNKPDVVHGNTPKASFLSMCAAWITRVRVRIYMCHGLRYQGCTGLKRKLLMNMERITCWCATTVVCVSYGIQNQLISDRICPKRKLRIIRNGSVNGVDMNWYDRNRIHVPGILRKQFSIPDQNLVFLFVGRIVRDKGIKELVTAFGKLEKQYSDISLLLVGAYENLDPIDVATKEMIDNDSNIRPVGIQSDVRPFYGLADVLVLPSYREGFGMVLIEAGAMKLPCITTDIVGCNEIIVNGQNGLIIPKQDADALYEAMKYMYEHPQKRLAMASCARKMITSRYRQQNVWKATLDMYKALG